jgi:hypothetical protein
MVCQLVSLFSSFLFAIFRSGDKSDKHFGRSIKWLWCLKLTVQPVHDEPLTAVGRPCVDYLDNADRVTVLVTPVIHTLHRFITRFAL